MTLNSPTVSLCRLYPGKARRANFWDGVIPLVLDLKQQLNSVVLRVVVDAYFCKVPFLAPLVAAGISVVTRMRKDAVAWDQRIESGTRKADKQTNERVTGFFS